MVYNLRVVIQHRPLQGTDKRFTEIMFLQRNRGADGNLTEACLFDVRNVLIYPNLDAARKCIQLLFPDKAEEVISRCRQPDPHIYDLDLHRDRLEAISKKLAPLSPAGVSPDSDFAQQSKLSSSQGNSFWGWGH